MNYNRQWNSLSNYHINYMRSRQKKVKSNFLMQCIFSTFSWFASIKIHCTFFQHFAGSKKNLDVYGQKVICCTFWIIFLICSKIPGSICVHLFEQTLNLVYPFDKSRPEPMVVCPVLPRRAHEIWGLPFI
jgi:hypothetical protein